MTIRVSACTMWDELRFDHSDIFTPVREKTDSGPNKKPKLTKWSPLNRKKRSQILTLYVKDPTRQVSLAEIVKTLGNRRACASMIVRRMVQDGTLMSAAVRNGKSGAAPYAYTLVAR